LNKYIFYRDVLMTGPQIKRNWNFNYRGTGMARNEWLAIKLLRMLKKQKRFPIKWAETRTTITITFE